VERGRLDEAIQLCEERRTRPGNGVGDRIVLGRAYLADGRLSEARFEFEAALKLDRENVVALKALAGILSHSGDHDQATGYYRAVCRIDPGDLESQTAVHQITSGEFPEARPADVIVGQGDLSWQPVRLPREEEHLPELGLGLRTIETFDPGPSPAPYPAALPDFQELPIERLGRMEREAATAPAEAPAEAPAAGIPSVMELAPALVPPSDAVAAPEAPPALAEPPSQAFESPTPSPVPAPRPSGPMVEGNKSAFQEWLERLGGKRS